MTDEQTCEGGVTLVPLAWVPEMTYDIWSWENMELLIS